MRPSVGRPVMCTTVSNPTTNVNKDGIVRDQFDKPLIEHSLYSVPNIKNSSTFFQNFHFYPFWGPKMPMVPNLLLKPEKSPQGSIHLYAKSYIAPVVKQPETQHAYKTESFYSYSFAVLLHKAQRSIDGRRTDWRTFRISGVPQPCVPMGHDLFCFWP